MYYTYHLEPVDFFMRYDCWYFSVSFHSPHETLVVLCWLMVVMVISCWRSPFSLRGIFSILSRLWLRPPIIFNGEIDYEVFIINYSPLINLKIDLLYIWNNTYNFSLLQLHFLMLQLIGTSWWAHWETENIVTQWAQLYNMHSLIENIFISIIWRLQELESLSLSGALTVTQ